MTVLMALESVLVSLAGTIQVALSCALVVAIALVTESVTMAGWEVVSVIVKTATGPHLVTKSALDPWVSLATFMELVGITSMVTESASASLLLRKVTGRVWHATRARKGLSTKIVLDSAPLAASEEHAAMG